MAFVELVDRPLPDNDDDFDDFDDVEASNED
jgi:hypothetical protein